ncbi:MAG: signal transduction histidine kinase/ActR/RegA family two-component response regulator [Candidatus Azotimanducaceae bacterium]|jgi:signal transduction histidine kinase/ActR/RegA family two-component response regulator
MISIALYALGLLCRFAALYLAARVFWLRFSWRFCAVMFGVGWISIQPILQFFFSESSDYISEIQQPAVFFITSFIALFAIYQLHEILVDNERYAKKATDEEERFGRRQSILLSLAKLRSPDLHAALRALTEANAEELGTQRVGIWVFNKDKSAVTSIIILDQGIVKTEPEELFAKDYPAYFAGLEDGGLVVADDARHHATIFEFTETYLKPNNIYSVLDIPIRVEGELVGVICYEQTRAARHWTLEDQDFGHSIADLCAIAMTTDKKKQIEARLQASERHLSNAQNVGQFGSFRWDQKKHEVFWSGEVIQKLAFETKKQPPYEYIRTLIDENYLNVYEDLFQQATKEETPLRARVKTKTEYGGEFFEIRAAYRKDEQSPGGCFEGTVQNITDQVTAEHETQQLEEQLIQSQKMESIGTLAGGIAHDFNNILTPILGYTDVAMSQLEPGSPIKESLQEVLNSSLRAKDLVEQMLVFSRRWDERKESLDLQDTLNSVLKLVRPTLPATIEIEIAIVPGYKMVEADSTQMVQVLLNLCTNAWHAMEPRGGTLTLKLTPAIRNSKEMVALEVTDTGMGIEADSLKRIFDPFFTTKDVGKGTGLGLSVVHGIIAKLDGEICVTSQPGATRFTIFLAATDEAPKLAESLPETAQKTMVAEEPDTTPAKSASILLVDDDIVVARTMEAMLISLGYQADVHLDSVGALECFQRGEQHYDLLLTDLTMPVMSGIELIRKIREQAPLLPVLVVSGYAEEQVKDQLIGLDRCHIVGKPIMKADLALAIQKELSDADSGH